MSEPPAPLKGVVPPAGFKGPVRGRRLGEDRRRVWVENGYAWILVVIKGHVKQGTLQNPRITWNSDEKLAPPRNLSVLDLLFAAQFQSRGIAVVSEVGEGGQEITVGYEMDAKGSRGRIGQGQAESDWRAKGRRSINKRYAIQMCMPPTSRSKTIPKLSKPQALTTLPQEAD